MNLSPWQKFKRHKRAWLSLWGFSAILLLSCAAPFLCNNRPILAFYKGNFLFPLWNYYPETLFGGQFDLEMDYKSPEFKSAVQEEKGWALWPPIPYNPFTLTPEGTHFVLAPPSLAHPLGTDDQGRDVLTRLLYGLRTSLLFGLALAFGSSFLGLCAGALQGYYGGWVDLIFQRVIEIWSGLPQLFLMMIFSSLIRPTLFWLLLMMIFFNWTNLVGLVRVEFLRARQYTYVRAAQVLGIKPWRIMVRHILPNVMASTLSYFPFLVSSSISTLTALDFLGFGLPPGSPSLGDLLQQAKTNLYAPWLGLTAFFGISIILVLVTFIGEGLRDAYDPKTNG